MQILIYSDNHFCATSSIVRGNGEQFTNRLENQILSVNWAEKVAQGLNCAMIIHAGDFFDKSTLDSQELTALSKIEWAKIPHLFLAGNHEMGSSNHKYSSLYALASENRQIITEPVSFDDGFGRKICLLPYVLEKDRIPLKQLFGDRKENRIIISHNDISGIQYGGFESKIGYSVDEIEEVCDLYLNGHLHNSSYITPKIFNIGNLTGQNFSEDAFLYNHHAVLLTITQEDVKITCIENPYAYNFYKLSNIEELLKIKYNAVVAIKVDEKKVDEVKQMLDNNAKISESRVIMIPKITNTVIVEETKQTVDHLKEFSTFATEVIGKSDILLEELSEVCG